MFVGLSNQTAFDNVDSYAQARCGTPVFALASLAAAEGDSHEAEAVSTVLCPDITTTVDVGADRRELLTALEAAEQYIPGVAGELLAAIETLDPAASTAMAALGRLRWRDGVDPDTAIARADSQVWDECGVRLLADDFVSVFKELGPRPVAAATGALASYQLGSYDPECPGATFERYEADTISFWGCRDTSFLLDLTTGAVTPVSGYVGHSGSFKIDLTYDETPAEGLSAAGMRFTLTREGHYGWDTLKEWDLDGVSWQQLQMAANARGHILLREGTDRALMYDVDGNLVDQMETDDIYDVAFSEVFDGVYASMDILANLHTGQLSSHSFRDGLDSYKEERDLCRSSQLVRSRDGNAIVTLRADGTLDARSVSSELRRGAPLGSGVFNDYHELRSDSGEILWEFDFDVVDRWVVFDGQLVVQNHSGQVVGVETESGMEAPIPTEYLPVVTALLEEDHVHLDPYTGRTVVNDFYEPSLVDIYDLPGCSVR
jgi:hypothetical protein